MSYRVAIIGAGGIAIGHLRALESMTSIKAVAVADLVEERVREVSDTFGITPYTDYKQMITEEKPDIAVVTLPHFLHKEAAIFCADAGVHTILEKPMALNVLECDEIIAAFERNHRKCMIGHTQHYIEENQVAKEIIQSGELGELIMMHDVRHVNYFSDKRPMWFLEKAKSGGGILANLGSHSIDKLQWFGESPIVEVYASLVYPAPRGDVEAGGTVFLKNENGIPCTITQSGLPGAVKNETELIFTNGMLRVVTGNSLWISKEGKYEQIEVEQSKPSFVKQFEDMQLYIEQNIAPACTMEYSRSIVAVTEAIYASHEKGMAQRVSGHEKS